MLLKLGVAAMLLSLTLAAGVAAAVAGLRGETPAATPVSSVKPQAAETPAQKKQFNPGEKLEIDHGTDEEPPPENSVPEASAPEDSAPEDSAPATPGPERSTSERAAPEEPVSEEPVAKSRPKSAPAPPPAEAADWPQPTNDELASADEPRYFNPAPDTEMNLTVGALGLYDVPVITSDSLDALDTSLMHVPETSFPWDGGAQRNVYIVGHYLGYPGTNSRLVFYNLDKLSNGDEVDLKDSGGRVYRYRVSESFTANPDESWVMGQELNRDMVTLQTCIPPDFGRRLLVRADRV